MALQDFITHVKQIGMFVGNKFELVAPAIDGALPTASSTVSMLCQATNLPGISLMSNEIRIFGEITEKPYGIIYNPVTLTFYIDNELSAKRYFEQWSNLIFNRETRSLNYYDLYTRDVEIVVYNKAEEEIERIKLLECYPKIINDINLDYHANSVATYTVQLIYKWWESTKTDSWSGSQDKNDYMYDYLKPNYGYDATNLGSESFMNTTGQTPYGLGMPNSPDSLGIPDYDLSGSLTGLATDFNSSMDRGFDSAANLFGFSDLDYSIANPLTNVTRDLSGHFNGIGRGLGDLGGNVNNIGAPIYGICNSVNGVALGTSNLGSLMNQIGPSSNFNVVSGQISQVSNQLAVVQNISQVPQYLTSISSQFNQIGSMISQNNQAFRNSSSYNSATGNAFGQLSNNYFSAGSYLNRAATAIGNS